MSWLFIHGYTCFCKYVWVSVRKIELIELGSLRKKYAIITPYYGTYQGAFNYRLLCLSPQIWSYSTAYKKKKKKDA